MKILQINASARREGANSTKLANTVTERLKAAHPAATVMFATIPILLIYPWLQKYFIAGVTIGAVKG